MYKLEERLRLASHQEKLEILMRVESLTFGEELVTSPMALSYPEERPRKVGHTGPEGCQLPPKLQKRRPKSKKNWQKRPKQK